MELTVDGTDKPPVKAKRTKKPPTQTAGVSGIDGHGGMGEAPIPDNAYIDWRNLVNLPAFEMFVLEQSGQIGSSAGEWVSARRAAISDSVLYDQYAAWHKDKGLWVNETPTGKLIEID